MHSQQRVDFFKQIVYIVRSPEIFNTFGGSSAAEQLTVNQLVVGSIPTPRANKRLSSNAGVLLYFRSDP